MSVERPVSPRVAITHYRAIRRGVLGPGLRITQVHCRLETGRTHQIRVHLASIGHPLLADALYGGRTTEPATRQMLHARRLGFDDPASGRPVAFSARPPADMQAAIDAVAWEAEADYDDGYDDDGEDDAWLD